MNLKAYISTRQRLIHARLRHYLPRSGKSRLEEAMRYAVLSDGKRIRPILVLAAAECAGGDVRHALAAACAVEFIHSYSLVHDDLPCMDDDDTRRGRPACHKKFGEVTALLAGDALLTLAFQTLAQTRSARAVSVLAQAAGYKGMVGGQALDMEYQGRKTNLKTLTRINAHKTGDLIAVSLKLGAITAQASAPREKALEAYGRDLGLLFQIVDDILDRDGYARILGVKRIEAQADRLCRQSKKRLQSFGSQARILTALADFVRYRKH